MSDQEYAAKTYGEYLAVWMAAATRVISIHNVLPGFMTTGSPIHFTQPTKYLLAPYPSLHPTVF